MIHMLCLGLWEGSGGGDGAAKRTNHLKMLAAKYTEEYTSKPPSLPAQSNSKIKNSKSLCAKFW